MKPAPRPPGTRQVLFTFPQLAPTPGETGVLYHFSQCAHRPFLPLGLFVWGARPDTMIERLLVGNQHEGSLTQAPVPARYFETGRSMVELEALADQGELELSIEQRRVIEMDVAEVGSHVGLSIRGPFEDVCFWGLTYAYQMPLLTQVIDHVQKPVTSGMELGDDWKGFRGRVIEHHLGGDRVISNVYAPSEESVCRLLLGARSPARMY